MKDFKNLDRALCDGTTNGFVKIITKSNSDKILGATIVGPQAGDMICQISVAMANKLGRRENKIRIGWSGEGYISVPDVCGVIQAFRWSVQAQTTDTQDQNIPTRDNKDAEMRRIISLLSRNSGYSVICVGGHIQSHFRIDHFPLEIATFTFVGHTSHRWVQAV